MVGSSLNHLRHKPDPNDCDDLFDYNIEEEETKEKEKEEEKQKIKNKKVKAIKN
jgi:hypothetical protein